MPEMVRVWDAQGREEWVIPERDRPLPYVGDDLIRATAIEVRDAKRERTVSSQLGLLRMVHGLSLAEVADAVRVSRTALYSWERRIHGCRERDQRVRLALFYDVPMPVLFDRKGLARLAQFTAAPDVRRVS